MLGSKLLRLLPATLLSLQATSAAQRAEAVREDAEQLEKQGQPGAGQSANLAVDISTTFPHAEIFGVKLVNGQPTTAQMSITNKESFPVQVRFLGGSLWTPDVPGQPSFIYKNLTSMQLKPTEGIISAGQSESIVYRFTTNHHPQDLRLNLVAMLVGERKDQFYPMSAFNETVSIVEPPMSFFDPQTIFLYITLLAVFGGVAYFIYNTWVSTLFPQKKRVGGKGGERAKTNSRQTKSVDPSDQVSVAGADGPAVTSGAKFYDESWIPQAHLKRPEAKRIRSGTPSGVKTKRAA